MTDNKSQSNDHKAARRVMLLWDNEFVYDKHRGSHALVPWEVWERVVGMLESIVAQGDFCCDMYTAADMVRIARRALAEIGEVGDES